jgi:hypothetical protein
VTVRSPNPRRGARRRPVIRRPVIRRRHAARLSAAALLGVGAALLVSCGSSGSGLIPMGDAGPLEGDFQAVAQAAREGDGDCTATEAAIGRMESDLHTLPATVDAGLRGRLEEGTSHLRARALTLCAQPLAQATATTSQSTIAKPTKTTPTTSTTGTQTTPTTSTPTTSTTSTGVTPTTSVPSGAGGGTPAPGSEGRAGEGEPGASGGGTGVGEAGQGQGANPNPSLTGPAHPGQGGGP